VIYSADPGIVNDLNNPTTQTVTVISTTGTATTTFGQKEVTLTFTFSPGCAASQITSDHAYTNFKVTPSSSVDFDLNAASYSHLYKDAWIAKGYSDGCTIGWRIDGTASTWVTISGSTVTIAPTASTFYGQHDVALTAYYSASTFETTPPVNSSALQKILDITVNRGGGIETWSTYTITALAVALVLQAVVVGYLSFDNVRRDTWMSV